MLSSYIVKVTSVKKIIAKTACKAIKTLYYARSLARQDQPISLSRDGTTEVWRLSYLRLDIRTKIEG